ncbi:MAG TPA: hypothetical protein VGC51_11535, partial [Hansschlegelia sp.]
IRRVALTALIAAAFAAGPALAQSTTVITEDPPSTTSESKTTVKTHETDEGTVEKRKTITKNSDGRVDKQTTTTHVEEPAQSSTTVIQTR